MKRIGWTFVLVALLALALLSGCSKCNLAESNKAIVVAAIDAMNAGQWDDLDKYFAPDFKRYSQATPDAVIESLEDFKAFGKEWYTSFPDAQMKLHLTAAEGDLVAVWVTFAGTHSGPMGTFPPTGKKMESETFGFFRMENGLIKESWVTWDNVAVMTQLGLTPPPPMPAEEAAEGME